MPRRVEVTIPSEQSDALVDQLSGFDGLIGLQVQPGISRQPEGDVLTLDVTNRALHPLLRLLHEQGVGTAPGASLSTSDVLSVVSSSHRRAIVHDPSDASWEEMELRIAKDSNMTINDLLVMAVSGIIATIGIATNALHIVIGAMLIAPGFEPIVRIALGALNGSEAWQRGLIDTLKGYLALSVGAAAAGVLLLALGKSPLGAEASYLPAGTLISYWTTLTIPSVVVTFVAGAIGALLVATNRAVLTAGVMVALALVPSAAIAGLALSAGDLAAAGQGGLRWLVEVGLVLAASLLVFAWKRASVQKRAMLL
jgi:hypothetical protein